MPGEEHPSPDCKYSNILGQPGQGIHAHLFGVAVFDVLATVAVALGVWYLLRRMWRVGFGVFWLILFSLFLLSIVVHRLFCVRTTVDKLLFPN
jgi:hypothetical protein